MRFIPIFGGVFLLGSLFCNADVPARSGADMLNQQWSRGKAAGAGPVKLSNFPLRAADIGYIIPMGLTASGHVTPSDHLYLVPTKTDDKTKRFDVLAVADGQIVMMQWRPNPPGGQPDPTVFDRAVDLKVFIEHSATCWSYVDHLVEVDAALLGQFGEVKPGQPVHGRVPVKAGQVIGKVGYQTFDFSLIDATRPRKGFIKPEQFASRDSWKLYAADPFDYLDEAPRKELLLLNVRKIEPFGGRIDYDIEGRLVGNWYRKDSGGYAGTNRRIDYWDGHLSIVYDHITGVEIVFSIGNYEGKPRQFWVKGNAPDPAKISAADGLVKYELIPGGRGSAGQKQIRHDANEPLATGLMQVLADGTMRFELFPGKRVTEVNGFTQGAKVFER